MIIIIIVIVIITIIIVIVVITIIIVTVIITIIIIIVIVIVIVRFFFEMNMKEKQKRLGDFFGSNLKYGRWWRRLLLPIPGELDMGLELGRCVKKFRGLGSPATWKMPWCNLHGF